MDNAANADITNMNTSLAGLRDSINDINQQLTNIIDLPSSINIIIIFTFDIQNNIIFVRFSNPTTQKFYTTILIPDKFDVLKSELSLFLSNSSVKKGGASKRKFTRKQY
jgi:hypothetical protein